MSEEGILFRDSSRQDPRRGLKLTFGCLFFGIEGMFLLFLLAEIFMVPQLAPPWGDLPYQIEWAILSALFALLSGLLFLMGSRHSERSSLANLLKTPPAIACLTVFVVASIPAFLKWHALQMQR